MGCLDCLDTKVDPEIAKILATLDIKVEEYQDVFEKEEQNAKNAFEAQQKERKRTLDNWKKESKEITEQDIRKLNKAEFEVEVKFLVNQLDKMHYIFSIALELIEPIKKVTLDKLMEQAKSAPAMTLNTINKQIEEIKSFPPLEFYNATYGKVLRQAVEKKGMSKTVLNGYRNKLSKERKERRKVERDLYNIEKNEFDDEEMDEKKLDLFSLITKEEEGLNNNFKEYARGKIIDAMFASQ